MFDRTAQKTKSSPTELDGRSAESRSGKDDIAKRPGVQCSEYLQQIGRPQQSGQIQNEQKLVCRRSHTTWLNANIDSTLVTPPGDRSIWSTSSKKGKLRIYYQAYMPIRSLQESGEQRFLFRFRSVKFDQPNIQGKADSNLLAQNCRTHLG